MHCSNPYNVSEQELKRRAFRRRVRHIIREEVKKVYDKLREEEWKRFEKDDPTLYPKVTYYKGV